MSICMSYHLPVNNGKLLSLETQVCWGSWQKCLASLCQSFTNSYCYPERSQWTGTLANVTHICTEGWKEGLENYRPVILTLVPGKVMQEIGLSTITQYVQGNQFIRLGQHGQVLRDKPDLLLWQGDPLSGWRKTPCMLYIWALVKPLTPLPTALSWRN